MFSLVFTMSGVHNDPDIVEVCQFQTASSVTPEIYQVYDSDSDSVSSTSSGDSIVELHSTSSPVSISIYFSLLI